MPEPGKPSDVRVVGVQLYLLPVRTRVPLKFGSETLTAVTCARVRMTVEDRRGRRASGWGETPLSVQWAWPGPWPYETRLLAMVEFCRRVAAAWLEFAEMRHPLELGFEFNQAELPELRQSFVVPSLEVRLPRLAALVCASPFDIALHDAYGVLHSVDTYATYNAQWMSCDLAAFLDPAFGADVSFHSKYPADFLAASPPPQLRAWHLVGGLDLLEAGDLRGDEPQDGYPVALTDWIERDGLSCLKIKLRGDNEAWDFARLVRVGRIAAESACDWLSADFNCTVREPFYVNRILDRLRDEHPRIFGMLLYVEQPFPYELEEHPIDVHSVAARKPLFLDESAHDWAQIRRGRELGWNGVALKTCKTQTGAILSLCWAKAHGMALMVQDLTNPMLAQIPHLRLAAAAETVMGVETNAMQFYPAASEAEAKVHPGIYLRREGRIELDSLRGPGMGYRIAEIERILPECELALGEIA